MTESYHRPVLADEVLAAAAGARRVVDATLGGGGHAALLAAKGVTLLGIDRDPAAIAAARQRPELAGIAVVHSPYAEPAALAAVRDFHPDFILLDLGVSSHQLDAAERGFTFRPGAPLDMRMSGTGLTAGEWLDGADEADLKRVFAEYGDERRAGALSREVVRRRERGSFKVSDDLVNVIRAVLGPRSGPGDFARLFQAVRIEINGELDGLQHALPAFRDALVSGGRLAVISYHSGEDRLVKHSFREWARSCICPPELPQCICRGHALGRLVGRAVEAGAAEMAANPRARSARLRVFQVA
ncbi:MAG TPA: 16S rRNA (cytosine(1402)-N(4))-methyltransferase RsmH [Gemmatimonadales bacterium]|nr:16S rRNA (cytosine(1402)-N(4))-methyltransferase RsmH [Gemmatimonadales bacterium]